MKFNRISLLFLIMIFTSGCMTVLDDVRPDDLSKISNEQGLVFGKYVQFRKYGSGNKIILRSLSDGKRYELAFTKNNHSNSKAIRLEGNMLYTEDPFSWILPTGRYEIASIVTGGGMYYVGFIHDPKIFFEVYPNQETYIGSFNFLVPQKKNYLLFENIKYVFWVSDEFYEAQRILENEINELSNVKKELMVISEESKFFDFNKEMSNKTMKDFLGISRQ